MTVIDRLDGWGEMCAYMRCTRKAYLRRGYPVHYEVTGRVYALKSELVAWAGQQTPTNAHERPQTPISTEA